MEVSLKASSMSSEHCTKFHYLYSFNNITDIGQAIVTQASGDEDRKDESRFWDVLAQDDLFKKDGATDGGAGGPRRRNSGGMPRAMDEDMGQGPPHHGARGRQQAGSTSDLMEFQSNGNSGARKGMAPGGGAMYGQHARSARAASRSVKNALIDEVSTEVYSSQLSIV